MSWWRARWAMVLGAVALVALAAAAYAAYGGVSQRGSLADRVRAWDAAAGLGGSIGTVQGDLARVASVLGAHKPSGVVHTDCAVLSTDARAANGNLPTPDAQLTRLLSDAYTAAYEAGTDCYDSGGTNHRLLARSATERRRATAQLRQAFDRVAALTGRPLSTTTTLGAGGGLFG